MLAQHLTSCAWKVFSSLVIFRDSCAKPACALIYHVTMLPAHILLLSLEAWTFSLVKMHMSELIHSVPQQRDPESLFKIVEDAQIALESCGGGMCRI